MRLSRRDVVANIMEANGARARADKQRRTEAASACVQPLSCWVRGATAKRSARYRKAQEWEILRPRGGHLDEPMRQHILLTQHSVAAGCGSWPAQTSSSGSVEEARKCSSRSSSAHNVRPNASMKGMFAAKWHQNLCIWLWAKRAFWSPRYAEMDPPNPTLILLDCERVRGFRHAETHNTRVAETPRRQHNTPGYTKPVLPTNSATTLTPLVPNIAAALDQSPKNAEATQGFRRAADWQGGGQLRCSSATRAPPEEAQVRFGLNGRDGASPTTLRTDLEHAPARLKSSPSTQ